MIRIILRFEVPEGKLVYFGTIKVVIDSVMGPSLRRYSMPNKTPMMFKYHFTGIDEDETLKHFENQYPQAYSSYKDKIIRIPSSSRPTYVTLLPNDHCSDYDLSLVILYYVDYRRFPGRAPGGNCGTQGSSLVSGLPVSPGIQITADKAPSTVQ